MEECRRLVNLVDCDFCTIGDRRYLLTSGLCSGTDPYSQSAQPQASPHDRYYPNPILRVSCKNRWGIAAATTALFYSVAAFFPYLVISREIISRDRDCVIWKPIPSRGESSLFQIMLRTSIIAERSEACLIAGHSKSGSLPALEKACRDKKEKPQTISHLIS
jgi:hypothetical protein